MRNLIIILIAICFSSSSWSQQLTTTIGRVSPAFDYADSEGQELDNLHAVNGFHYTIGYRVTLSEKMFLNASLAYNNYVMEGSDPTLDNYYRWNTKYLGLSVRPEFEFLQVKKFRIAAQGDLSPQWMVKGQQTINNQIFSLKDIEQFDSPFLFLRGGLSANYCLDEKVALSMSYFYGVGSPFSKSDDGEKLKLKSSTFSIGLYWSMKKCKYCQNRRTN